MAAIAIAVLNKRSTFKGTQTVRPKRVTEPLTVHLQGIVDENDADDAIAVLERLAERDSLVSGETMSRLTTHGTWLHTRFIVTKTRLFLLVKRQFNNSVFEVVDSIPMHEITKVKVLKDVRDLVDDHQLQHQPSTRQTEESDLSGVIESKLEAILEDTTREEGTQLNLNTTFLKIHTQSNGFNHGRAFVIDAGSANSCQEWVRELSNISKEACEVFRRRNKIEYYQRYLKSIHDATPYRVAVFLAIAANFVISMMEAQLGDGSNRCGYEAFQVQDSAGNETIAKNTEIRNVYEGLDLGFTIFFLIGLYLPVPLFVSSCFSQLPIHRAFLQLRRARRPAILRGQMELVRPCRRVRVVCFPVRDE